VVGLQPILPSSADNRYGGPRITAHVLVAIAVLSLLRSCIHMFAADGGAHSIAGIDISVAGGATVVGLFAQWGLKQVLLAFVDLLIALRYRALIPLAYVLIFLAYAGRELLGFWKPLGTLGTHGAPGVIGDYIMIPLAALMFALSVWGGRRRS
jgi:hypothetical protein